MLLAMSGAPEYADFDYPASGRFGTGLAEAPLVLSQELANTIGIDHLPELVDLLGQVDIAQHWIDAVVPHWCTSFGADDPDLVVTAAELPRLRAVRDALRSVIGEPEDPRDDALIAGSAAIAVTRAGAHLEPVGSGASWLAAAIAVEAVRAHALDSYRRLKLCHQQRCAVAFYDRSKNNSRVWHDTATCGNQVNSRAHRGRRRQQSL
jgi:CGNR zinc finger protein/putative stress-induced transcription regulator